jgi:pimeloyl-ACP methyl ester carboxylesterase
VAGVVNVDQPLEIRPFAQLLGQLGPALRGPDFERVWRDVFFASFHIEQLPEPAAALARETSVARQDLVLSYWRQVLEEPADDVMAMIVESAGQLRAKNVPYTILLGRAPAPGEVDGMRALVPALQVESWPDSSHLPHLAAPDRFADLVLSAARAVDPAAV